MKKRWDTLRQSVIRATGPMTPLGRALLALGLAAWAIGARFGWRELSVIAGACLLALLVAVLFTFGRTELQVDVRLNPPRLIAGEKAVADVAVINAASRRMLPVRLEIPVGQSIAPINVPFLGAGDTFEETVLIPTLRRCVLAVGPVRSVRGDPLGLMRREVQWSEAHELFVHPVTARLTGIAAGWLRDLEGRPTNDRSPSDVSFHTLREYVPGDDRRHVHWRTSARIGKLMVRQFIDNRRSHLGVVVDTNPASYADAEEFELAVSMAASLGLRVIAEGQELSCVAGNRGINAHTGQALLDGLAGVELGVPAITIQETAMRAAPMVTAASVVALVSGSAMTLADLQLAAQRFGLDTQVLALRATLGEEPGMTRAARLLSITADSLDSFTRVMWVVTNS